MCDARNDFRLNCLPQKSHSNRGSVCFFEIVASILLLRLGSIFNFFVVQSTDVIVRIFKFIFLILSLCRLRSVFAKEYEFSILMKQGSSRGFVSLPLRGSSAGELKQIEVKLLGFGIYRVVLTMLLYGELTYLKHI